MSPLQSKFFCYFCSWLAHEVIYRLMIDDSNNVILLIQLWASLQLELKKIDHKPKL